MTLVRIYAELNERAETQPMANWDTLMTGAL